MNNPLSGSRTTLGTALKAKPKSAPAINNRFKRLKSRFFTKVSVSKKEASIFKPLIAKLRQKKTFSESEVRQALEKDFQRKPYYLSARSSATQLAVLSWFIGGIQNPSSQIKQELIQKVIQLTTQSAVDTEDETNKTLKEHGVDSSFFKSKKSGPGSKDPLTKTPDGIPIADDLTGKQPVSIGDLLPEGKGSGVDGLPADIKTLLQNADPLQRITFMVLAKHVYTPVAKWYNGLKRDTIKRKAASVLMKSVFYAFKRIIKKYNAKYFARKANGASKSTESFVRDVDIILRLVNKFSKNTKIPSSVRSLLSKNVVIDKNATKENFMKVVSTILSIGGKVMDIAARSPFEAQRKRIANKPNCFFQNKLYILILMQYKKSKGTQKLIYEFFGNVISNLNGDNELRSRAADLKGSIATLAKTSAIGYQLCKMAGYGKQWKENPKLRNQLIDSVLAVLWPSAKLTKTEKSKTSNKALLSLHALLKGAAVDHVKGVSKNTDKTRLLLAINMLFDNLRVQLVSAHGDPIKAKKMISSLTRVLTSYKKSLHPLEMKQIKSKNQMLALLLDNPAFILKSMIQVASTVDKPKKGTNSTVSRVAQGAVALTTAYKKETTKAKGRVGTIVRNVKEAKMLGTKIKLDTGFFSKPETVSYKEAKSRIVKAAKELAKIGRFKKNSEHVSRLLVIFSKHPQLYKKYFKLFHIQLMKAAPNAVASKVDVAVVEKAMNVTDKRHLLKRTMSVCDKFSQTYIDRVHSKAKHLKYPFRALVLSRIGKRVKVTRGEMNRIIAESFLQTIKGTIAYNENFDPKDIDFQKNMKLLRRRARQSVSSYIS